FPLAGRLGLPIFIGLRTTEISDLQVQLAPYRQAWREAGHPGEPSVYLRIPVYVSPTAEGAREEPRASMSAFFARQTDLARAAVGRAGAAPADRRRMQAERMAGLTYEDVLARKVVFGTAELATELLQPIDDALGGDVRGRAGAQGRLRHRRGRHRSAEAAPWRARPGRHRGRAESGRPHPARA